jgi:hypothetical protein
VKEVAIGLRQVARTLASRGNPPVLPAGHPLRAALKALSAVSRELNSKLCGLCYSSKDFELIDPTPEEQQHARWQGRPGVLAIGTDVKQAQRIGDDRVRDHKIQDGRIRDAADR